MKHDDLPGDLRPLYEAALSLGENPDLFRAFTTLLRDHETFAKAGVDAAETLRGYGVDVPDGLIVTFGRGDAGKPVPGEWWPFEIVLSNCRKFYRLNTDKQPPMMEETEEICFTITITPRPVPGGPWG